VRIAYLILAYHQPRHVAALIAQLDTPAARFFVHVDRKSDIAPFRAAIPSPHVTLVEERLPIYWGGWNMVSATLELLRRARREAHADYYQLLSDSCVAIKSNAAIARRLDGSSANYLTIDYEITTASPLLRHSPGHDPCRAPICRGAAAIVTSFLPQSFYRNGMLPMKVWRVTPRR